MRLTIIPDCSYEMNLIIYFFSITSETIEQSTPSLLLTSAPIKLFRLKPIDLHWPIKSATFIVMFLRNTVYDLDVRDWVFHLLCHDNHIHCIRKGQFFARMDYVVLSRNESCSSDQNSYLLICEERE